MSGAGGKGYRNAHGLEKRMPGSLGGMIVGLGPRKKPEQLYVQIPQSSLHVAGKAMGSSWQPAALGNHVTEKGPWGQGPLARVDDMKKRVTKQLNCTPRLPLAHGHYLTGSSPLPP